MQYAEEFKSMLVEDLVKKLQKKFDEKFYLEERPQKKFDERYNVFYKKEDNENFLQQHNPDSFDILILKNGISCYKVNISFKDKKIRITNAYKDIKTCIHNVELDSYNDVDRVVEGIYDDMKQSEKDIEGELLVDTQHLCDGYKFDERTIIDDFWNKVRALSGKHPVVEKVLKLKKMFNLDSKCIKELTEQFKNRLGEEFNVELVAIPSRSLHHEENHGDRHRILITYNVNGKDEYKFTIFDTDTWFICYPYDCIDDNTCMIVDDHQRQDFGGTKQPIYVSKIGTRKCVNFIAKIIEGKIKRQFCCMNENDCEIEDTVTELQRMLGTEFKVNLIKNNLPNGKVDVGQYKAIEVLKGNNYRRLFKINYKARTLSSGNLNQEILNEIFTDSNSVEQEFNIGSDCAKEIEKIVKEDIEQFNLGNCRIYKETNIDNDIQDDNVITNEDNIINTNTDNIQIEDNNIQDDSNLINNGSDIVISSYDLESKINELKQKQDCINDINDINDTNIITNEEINNSSNVISNNDLSSKNNIFK